MWVGKGVQKGYGEYWPSCTLVRRLEETDSKVRGKAIVQGLLFGEAF